MNQTNNQSNNQAANHITDPSSSSFPVPGDTPHSSLRGTSIDPNSSGFIPTDSTKRIMETIKNVLGLGGSAPTSKEESLPDQHPLSGEEPVSGQLGAGTATDPYDAGNADGVFVHRRFSLQKQS